MKPTALASASLLAIAITLAGCGEERPANAPQPPAAATSANSPAAIPPAFAEADAQAVAVHYADLALAVFSDAHAQAFRLQQAIDTLLAEPSQANLEAARQAWIAARAPYMQSEVFRFGNPVVDDWRDSSTPGRLTKA